MTTPEHEHKHEYEHEHDVLEVIRMMMAFRAVGSGNCGFPKTLWTINNIDCTCKRVAIHPP
jgi:hypothetical protein